jgi:hypothetical protein
MQSSAERRRLLQAMHGQSDNAWLVLAKCAVGLAAIALLVVIGTSDLAMGTTSSAGAPTAAEPAAAQATMRTQEHRSAGYSQSP